MIQIGQPPATIDTPIEHLMACHRRIEDRLTTLERAADHLSDRPDAARDAIGACIRFLDSSGALHTRDEEESLFPRLRPLLSEAERAYVDALESQHRESEAVYAEVRRQANAAEIDANAYRASVVRLSALYRDHIRSEDEVLTALARRSLGPADLEAVSAEMRSRRA